jgi:hypothetical protein
MASEKRKKEEFINNKAVRICEPEIDIVKLHEEVLQKSLRFIHNGIITEYKNRDITKNKIEFRYGFTVRTLIKPEYIKNVVGNNEEARNYYFKRFSEEFEDFVIDVQNIDKFWKEYDYMVIISCDI